MLEKGERRTKTKNVDMHIVKKLLQWQKDCNEKLKGTKYCCTLYPKASAPCDACEHFDACSHYLWERDYIHKHNDAEKAARMRKKTSGKEKQKGEILNSHFSEDLLYPCEPFDFCCPDKNVCQEGKICPWNED